MPFSGGSERRKAEKHPDPSLLFQMAVLTPPQNDILDVEKSGRRRSTEEEEADVISVRPSRATLRPKFSLWHFHRNDPVEVSVTSAVSSSCWRCDLYLCGDCSSSAGPVV